MKLQKIFSILVFAGLMMIASASVYAQNSGMVELKKRILEKIASGTPAPVAEDRVDTEVPTANPSLIGQGIAPAAVFPKRNALIGTWNVTLTFGDGFQVKSILQVMPGAAEGLGSVLHASEFSLTLPNPTLPEQGAWEHVVGTQFIASYYGFAFTEQFAPFGKIGFRHAITMDSGQESFTGRAIIEGFDASGQLLFSDTCQTRGVRQRALAP
jgi:hypothetical protein